jgi:hypothetical protein
MFWSELEAIADKEDGPFSGHLRYYLRLLQDDPNLMAAARKVVDKQTCPEGKEYLRLESAGLVRRQDRRCLFGYTPLRKINKRCVCRYRLYEKFFKGHL